MDETATGTGITVEAVIRRERIILLASLALLLGISWLALLHLHGPAGAGHHHHLLTPHSQAMDAGGYLLAFWMWLVMMVAMMLPPVLPWILFFAATFRRHDGGRKPWLATAAFVAGYFTVWAGFCLAAAAVQLGLQQVALLHTAELRTGPAVGGILLLAAGVFQFSSFKAACLKHCRTPLGFFLSRWQDGPAGAFGMGFRHGGYCLGCCWALMGLSFALGIMNLLWMAALTVLLCVEKIAPKGDLLSRGFGILFGLWGLWLLLKGGGF